MRSPCSHEAMDRSVPLCNLQSGGKGPGLGPTNLSTYSDMATIPIGRGEGSWPTDTSGRQWARILTCSLKVIKTMMELGTGPSSSGQTVNNAKPNQASLPNKSPSQFLSKRFILTTHLTVVAAVGHHCPLLATQTLASTETPTSSLPTPSKCTSVTSFCGHRN